MSIRYCIHCGEPEAAHRLTLMATIAPVGRLSFPVCPGQVEDLATFEPEEEEDNE